MKQKRILLAIGMGIAFFAIYLILSGNTVLGLNRSTMIPVVMGAFFIIGFSQLYIDFKYKKAGHDASRAVHISQFETKDWILLCIGLLSTVSGLVKMFIQNDLAYGLLLSLGGVIILSFFGYYVTDGRKKG
jgi:hypothetical protein